MRDREWSVRVGAELWLGARFMKLEVEGHTVSGQDGHLAGSLRSRGPGWLRRKGGGTGFINPEKSFRPYQCPLVTSQTSPWDLADFDIS